jgi:hypothetical protein
MVEQIHECHDDAVFPAAVHGGPQKGDPYAGTSTLCLPPHNTYCSGSGQNSRGYVQAVLKYTEFEGSIIKYCHTQMKVQRHNKQLTSFRGVSERKGSSAANMADEIIIHASIILLK